MEMLKALLHNKTVLNDRVLWYDGDSTVDADSMTSRVISYDTDLSILFVEALTPAIIQYNKYVPKEKQFTVKTSVKNLSFDWNIPDEYKDLDVISHISEKLHDLHGNMPDFQQREERCAHELYLYEKYELFDTLRTLIYIINILVEKNIVWGVGRGSSVSSYVLHVIGVHDVDSFHYGLDITEFLREPNT